MPSANRLRWLAREVWKGRDAFVTFSFNATNQREKIRFMLQDDYCNSGVYRPVLLGAISAVDIAVQSCIVTDKGHRSKSRNCSIVEFWIQQVSEQPANVCEDDATHSTESGSKQLQTGAESTPVVESAASSHSVLCNATVEDVYPQHAASMPEGTLAQHSVVSFAMDVDDVPQQESNTFGEELQQPCSFDYMHEVIGHMQGGNFSQEDRVINLLINKPCTKTTFQQNLDSLSHFFSDRLPVLTKHLTDRFGIPGRDWADFEQIVSDRIRQASLDDNKSFTIGSVLARVQADRDGIPRASQGDSQRPRAERVMQPRKKKAKEKR